MAQIINLRAAKKARLRADARAQGDVNAAKYGRTQVQKAAEAAQAEKAKRDLNAHLRDDA
jgi:Domain of unknown function (DUF4169)